MRCPTSRFSSRPAQKRSSGNCHATSNGGSLRPSSSLGKIRGVDNPSATSGSYRELRMPGASGWGTTAASTQSKDPRSCSRSLGIGALFTTVSRVRQHLDPRKAKDPHVLGRRRGGPPRKTNSSPSALSRSREGGWAGSKVPAWPHATLGRDEFIWHSPKKTPSPNAWARIRTWEPLREGILSPSPLTWLGYPRTREGVARSPKTFPEAVGKLPTLRRDPVR